MKMSKVLPCTCVHAGHDKEFGRGCDSTTLPARPTTAKAADAVSSA